MNLHPYKYIAIPFFLGILLFILFQVQASEVDSAGILHESFWMLPVGYILVFISILWALLIFIKSKAHTKECTTGCKRMSCVKKICIGLIVFFVGFILGSRFAVFQYQDACLDLGGGMNPGGYGVCVVEVSDV